MAVIITRSSFPDESVDLVKGEDGVWRLPEPQKPESGKQSSAWLRPNHE
jgi:hypothetical protein